MKYSILCLLFCVYFTRVTSDYVNNNNNSYAKVVFVGDSITYYWMTDGNETWNQYYAQYDAKDVGVPGDTTENLYYGLLHGLVDNLTPKVAVLMIGTNNLNPGQNDTNQVIFDQINTIIHELRAKIKGVRILLLGILPRENVQYCDRIHVINSMISKYDDGKMVRFLDMEASFEISSGKLISDYYKPDLIHLSSKGYQVWAQTMNTLFNELINS